MAGMHQRPDRVHGAVALSVRKGRLPHCRPSDPETAVEGEAERQPEVQGRRTLSIDFFRKERQPGTGDTGWLHTSTRTWPAAYGRETHVGTQFQSNQRLAGGISFESLGAKGSARCSHVQAALHPSCHDQDEVHIATFARDGSELHVAAHARRLSTPAGHTFLQVRRFLV